MVSVLGKGVYGQVVRKGRYAYKVSTVGLIRKDISGWCAVAREIHSVGLSHANICKRYDYSCKNMRMMIKMEMGVPLNIITADPFQVLTCIAAATSGDNQLLMNRDETLPLKVVFGVHPSETRLVEEMNTCIEMLASQPDNIFDRTFEKYWDVFSVDGLTKYSVLK